jgi:hypothetical protein
MHVKMRTIVRTVAAFFPKDVDRHGETPHP